MIGKKLCRFCNTVTDRNTPYCGRAHPCADEPPEKPRGRQAGKIKMKPNGEAITNIEEENNDGTD
jgi:hypothetical protein